jgi:hypothetical protein
VYNAHLRVVHASIAANPVGRKDGMADEDAVEYTRLGEGAGRGVVSRAEEAALQKRVSWFVSHSSGTTRGLIGIVSCNKSDMLLR